MRRELPMAIVFVTGTLMIAEYFLKIPVLNQWAKSVQNGVIIVAAFSLGLACVNLLRIHSRSVMQRKQNWPYSLALIVALVFTAAVGIIKGPNNPTYKFWYDYLQSPCSATVYSMTSFYMAMAAYRTIRARSLEAGVLLACAVVLMLGRAPVGELIYRGFPGLANWLMTVVNVAAQRGIMIGSGIGAVAAGLRTLLGIQRGYSGGLE